MAPRAGCAEGLWRNEQQGTAGYFALRWDLDEDPQIVEACSNDEGNVSKSFRDWAAEEVQLGGLTLIGLSFKLSDVNGYIYLEQGGGFRGWFHSQRDHGIYVGVPAVQWRPLPRTANAPTKGAAKGCWCSENGHSGFFALRWDLPQVEVCSNEHGRPSGSFKLKSAELRPLGFIHIEFTLGDLHSAFVDIDYDGTVRGWFEGASNRGIYRCSPCAPDDSSVWQRGKDWQPFAHSAMDYPEYWSNRSGGFRSVAEVLPSDAMFGRMQELLDGTFCKNADGSCLVTRDRVDGKPAPTGLQLVNLERVEDSNMWWDYHRRRWRVMSKRGYGVDCTPLSLVPGTSGTAKTTKAVSALLSHVDELNNEHYLFHGSSRDAVASIAKSGFRIDLAGTSAGAAFGPGAYLAESSSKSDEYAKPDKDGIYSMLICRVCLGKIARTEHFYWETPEAEKLITAAKDGEFYDAVLGDRESLRGTYREFICFDSAAVYPEYVLGYTRLGPDY